jgi:squalene-hopene/tetraprenyl-beta-curcumene cyclase
MYEGGMGYDPATGRPYADLSNSYIAYEAMRLTENVEDLRKAGDARADLDWSAAQKFVQRVQNLPGSNDQPWASDDPAERGGFAYKPDSSMAGAVTNADGTHPPALLRKHDLCRPAQLHVCQGGQAGRAGAERIRLVRQTFFTGRKSRHGPAGILLFLHVLAKALAAYGDEVLVKPDGTRVAWREELIKKLISLQKVEADGTGYWVNSEGRWWEADPVLVTSYSLLALEIALPD